MEFEKSPRPATFRSRFASVAWPAERLEVAIGIRTTMSLGNDVIDCSSCYHFALLHTGLAEIVVTLENASTDVVPLGTITTLMTGLALLMLMPTFVNMSWAIA